MTPIAAPTLAPLVLPRTSAEPAFTGQKTSTPAAPAPRKNGQDPAAPPPAAATVTQNALRSDPAAQPEPIDPADFAPLRDYLDRYGTLTIDPRDPPWADPRPDLVDDHSRWWLVLEAAWRIDSQDPYGVYGALNGMRCCGARLELANPDTWGARPEDPPPTYRLVRGDELSEAEYADLRQRYLVPHREALTRLLSAPSAAQIAHPRAASVQTPGKTPEKYRHTGGAAPFTGRGAAAAAQPAPRKNGHEPAAQPALLETEPAAQSAPVPGGDW